MIATSQVLVLVAGLTVVAVAVGFGFRRVRALHRPVLIIDIADGEGAPIVVVNAGTTAIRDLEATLRFDLRGDAPTQLLERHRRARVLLPGERLRFPTPAGRESRTGGGEAVTLIRRVVLDAVGRDVTGRRITARDVLDDPVSWLTPEELSPRVRVRGS
jgi:hypothetical protein